MLFASQILKDSLLAPLSVPFKERRDGVGGGGGCIQRQWRGNIAGVSRTGGGVLINRKQRIKEITVDMKIA